MLTRDVRSRSLVLVILGSDCHSFCLLFWGSVALASLPPSLPPSLPGCLPSPPHSLLPPSPVPPPPHDTAITVNAVLAMYPSILNLTPNTLLHSPKTLLHSSNPLHLEKPNCSHGAHFFLLDFFRVPKPRSPPPPPSPPPASAHRGMRVCSSQVELLGA